MSTAESTRTVAGRPWPNGDPVTWVYVADLPTLPEVARAVEKVRRQMGWWWRWWWKKDIERATQARQCEYYFPGKQVIYRYTPRGLVVLRADEPGSAENEAYREAAVGRCEDAFPWTISDPAKPAVRAAAEASSTLAGRPWPNGDPATWLYVADLPTTPEVERKVQEKRRKMGWWWRWWWKKDIENARQREKCQHYFMRKHIVYRDTQRGMLVQMVGEDGAAELFAFQETIPADEREETWGWTPDEGNCPDWYHI